MFLVLVMVNSCTSDKSESARLQEALETAYQKPIDRSQYLIIPMLGCRFSLEETIDFCRRNAVSIKNSEHLDVIFTETPDTKTLNFMLGVDIEEICLVDTKSIFRDFDFYFGGNPLLVKCENGKVISIEPIMPDKLAVILSELEDEFS